MSVSTSAGMGWWWCQCFFPVKIPLFLASPQMRRSRCFWWSSLLTFSTRSRSWSCRWNCCQQLQDNREVRLRCPTTFTCSWWSAPLLAAAAALAAFSSSIAFSLASYSSFLAFHSFLLFMMPSNMGWICGWKRENSWKTRPSPNEKQTRGSRPLAELTASRAKCKV